MCVWFATLPLIWVFHMLMRREGHQMIDSVHSWWFELCWSSLSQPTSCESANQKSWWVLFDYINLFIPIVSVSLSSSAAEWSQDWIYCHQILSIPFIFDKVFYVWQKKMAMRATVYTIANGKKVATLIIIEPINCLCPFWSQIWPYTVVVYESTIKKAQQAEFHHRNPNVEVFKT